MNDDVLTFLKERLDKIDNQTEEMSDHLAEINATLAVQATDLQHHIKRTDLLEKRIEQVDLDVKPIKDHVNGINWLLKAVLTAGTLAAAVAGVVKLLKG